MLKQRLLTILFTTLLMSGCTTIDERTGQENTSNATKGGGIGALAGAIIGGLSASKDDRAKGILTGAAVGGAVGAGVGYYTDQQEAKLRQQLSHTGVSVQRQGQNINLVLPSAITFDTGSAQLRPAFLGTLERVANSLREFSNSQVQITGHTDSSGGTAINQQLSHNRANAVSMFLGERGIQPQRIHAVGMGASQPVANNNTVDGRAHNRRVEIKITPNENLAKNG